MDQIMNKYMLLLTNCEVHMAKYSDRSFKVQTLVSELYRFKDE